MLVKCPTCKKEVPFDQTNPWRPFCSERCKIIDLGAWANGAYKIEGAPGSADPDEVVKEMQKGILKEDK